MSYKDPEKIKAYKKQYMRENPKQQELARAWKKRNPEKMKAVEDKRRQSGKRKIWERKYREQNKEKLRIRLLRWNNETPKGRFNSYKCGARIRGLIFNLTLNEFMEYWQKPCSYCGGEIKTIGLDRVNNSLGYIKENIISCCIICNNMKKNLTAGIFLQQCRKISNLI